MAKKAAAKTTATTTPTPSMHSNAFETPSFFKNFKLNSLLFFAVAFLTYANTLTHGFVLDDSMIIYKNEYTTKGLAGIPGIFANDVTLGTVAGQESSDVVVGGRYRPFSVALFAVVYEFFGDAPLPYHLLSVLLFALCCVVVFSTLRTVFCKNGKNELLVWLASALFVVHPIHTEVVNNCKSLDEILALLFSLLALQLSVKAFRSGSKTTAALAGLAMLAACFSKENAATFVLLVPLTLWMDARNWKLGSENSKLEIGKSGGGASIFRASMPIWVGFALFLLARGMVVGLSTGEPQLNLINNSFVKFDGAKWIPFSQAEKLATIFYSLGKYLWLHVFPHPLSHDYYPRQIAIQTFASPGALLGLALHALLFIYGVVGFLRGKTDPVRWGILFYLTTLFLVSNLPFPIGTNMAERFVFMPSVGACLVLAGAFVWMMERLANRPPSAVRLLPLIAFGVICLLFIFKTFTRNPAYASNKTLLFADSKVAASSAKLQNSLGAVLLKEALTQEVFFKKQAQLYECIEYFNRAVAIHPTYAEAFFGRGSAFYLLKKYPEAIADFEKSLAAVPGRPEVMRNYAVALLDAGKDLLTKNENPALAVAYFTKSNQIVPGNLETLLGLGLAQHKLGKVTEARASVEAALRLDPNNQQVRQILEGMK